MACAAGSPTGRERVHANRPDAGRQDAGQLQDGGVAGLGDASPVADAGAASSVDADLLADAARLDAAVDSAASDAASDAMLDAASPVGTDPNVCPGLSISLSGSPLATSITADITGATPEATGSCGGGAGADAIYHLRAPASGTVRVNLSTPGLLPSFAPTLYARGDDCQSGPELGCDASSLYTVDASLMLNVTAGQDYYFFADQTLGTMASQYTLTITYQ